MDILKASTALFYHESTTSSGATTIVQLPLAFVRSGGVNLHYGYADYVGYHSYGWSRTSSSANGAYFLYFDTTGITPSGANNRYVGRSLRCL